MNREVPAAPPLAIAPKGEPTKQLPETGEDGAPLGALSTCRYCYGYHPGACPFIKVMEWHPGGQIARVVLKDRAALETLIIYPGDDDAEDTLRRALSAIAETDDLAHAQGLARALLESLPAESA